MKSNIIISLLILSALSSPALCPLMAQNHTYQIIDHVEWPGELTPPGESDCFVEFTETWTFTTRGALTKEVLSQESTCSGELKTLALPEGKTRIKDIYYEFMLLDPHVMESGNRAFREPDSMDSHTRSLQASLIELVKKYVAVHKDYTPDEELLSVYFHEEWEVDAGSGAILKKVKSITPVIWQRRQSTEGRGIDDAETGLPVYYKNPLRRIELRLP